MKKLVGYYASPRGKYLLLKNKVLTKNEFILYEAGIAFADWDNVKHLETYGTISLSQGEIEALLGFSKGFVSRFGKGLFNKGFWVHLENGRIAITGFELIEHKLLGEITKAEKVIDVPSYIAKLQHQIVNPQQPVVNPQQNTPKEDSHFQGQSVAISQHTPSKSLVSFKNSYLRTNEEYQRIWKDNNYDPFFTPDDMKLADESVYETTGISP